MVSAPGIITNCHSHGQMAKEVCDAHSYCTRKCIERALSTKITNDEADGHCYTLLGFNDLVPSLTPTFLFRNIFYLQLSPDCPKMYKISLCELKKIINISVHRTRKTAILHLQGA